MNEEIVWVLYGCAVFTMLSGLFCIASGGHLPPYMPTLVLP